MILGESIIWDQVWILYISGTRREYYVVSGESTVRYKALILHEIRRQYSMKPYENIMWVPRRILCEIWRRYCIRSGWIVYIRGVYYVRPGASILWDQASMLFVIKNLILKRTGQYFMRNLILKDLRAYFYERVIFIR